MEKGEPSSDHWGHLCWGRGVLRPGAGVVMAAESQAGDRVEEVGEQGRQTFR